MVLPFFSKAYSSLLPLQLAGTPALLLPSILSVYLSSLTSFVYLLADWLSIKPLKAKYLQSVWKDYSTADSCDNLSPGQVVGNCFKTVNCGSGSPNLINPLISEILHYLWFLYSLSKYFNRAHTTCGFKCEEIGFIFFIDL